MGPARWVAFEIHCLLTLNAYHGPLNCLRICRFFWMIYQLFFLLLQPFKLAGMLTSLLAKPVQLFPQCDMAILLFWF